MDRLTREQALLMTAFLWGQRGTCERLKVGCVIAREGRILVQGYNGAPPGLRHCPKGHGLPVEVGQVDHHFPEQCQAVHAEANAISWAARNGVALEGSDLFVTHAPCLQCARMIVTSGVSSVTYMIDYRLKDGVDLLLASKILVVRQDIDIEYLNSLG